MNGLLVFFIPAALWDAFTTFYGTLAILHGGSNSGLAEMMTKNPNTTLASIGFALIVVLLLLSAKSVIATGWHITFRMLIGVTFLYDVLTSYIGNQSLIINKVDSTASQFFIISGLTLAVSISTIVIPYLMEGDNS
ncbi:MAG: hypothetical protein CSB47_08355 [Proteobacteria bacterium]|nr:MAG: hypothetical protein CSB47_08355 [Pseudomonadota bacterium]